MWWHKNMSVKLIQTFVLERDLQKISIYRFKNLNVFRLTSVDDNEEARLHLYV